MPRLFCLPPAGGSAVGFRMWSRLLPPHIEVRPLELPGHGVRRAESPMDSVAALLEDLTMTIEPQLDKPYALFGHSNGALLAFELARHLRRRAAPLPSHLFVAGRRAPDSHASESPLSDLDDAGLIAWMRTIGGTPAQVLAEPDLLKLLLPPLRADLRASEHYTYAKERPLPFPIAALGGIEDARATPADLESWRPHTTNTFTLRLFPGGHFFTQTAAAEVLDTLAFLLDS